MKSLLLAGAACCALTSASHAAPLVVTYTTLPANGSYFAPKAISSTAPYEPSVTGSISGLRTSPFSDSTTRYDAVEADGSATFGVAPPPVYSADRFAKAAFVQGPANPSFGTGNDSFSFVWGTPDSYNGLTFYDGNTFKGQTSGSSAPPMLGTGSYFATVTGMGEFDRVVFTSDGANAFEFAAVSTVPLPASAPLFGAALLAFGAVGYGLKRKGSIAV